MSDYQFKMNWRRKYELKMTQQQLANAIGVKRETIVNIENGRCSPRLETADKIALALGTSLYEIFNLESQEPGKARNGGESLTDDG